MTHIERTAIIESTPDAAWGAFANFGAVDEWHPYFERVEVQSENSRGVGAARLCEFGPKLAIRETVLEWDEAARRMVIEIEFVKGTPPPIRNTRAAVQVTALDRGSAITLTMDYQAKFGPLGWVLDQLLITPQYAKVFGHMLAAVKGYVEDGRTPPPIAMPGSGRVLAAAS